jgi:hypothetical protein
MPNVVSRGQVVVAAATLVASFGCGPGAITSGRIESAFERTFANLVAIQVARLGLPNMPASDVEVTAICRRRATAGRSDAGAGDWTCTLVWQSPDRRTVRDTYDLAVTTDGCYTATVEGESLGGPRLRTVDGRDVKNLLYTFEGCFDTT